MMTETPVITKIDSLGPNSIPLLGSMPKSLRISCQTPHGPLDVCISESAALELTATLRTYFRADDSR